MKIYEELEAHITKWRSKNSEQLRSLEISEIIIRQYQESFKWICAKLDETIMQIKSESSYNNDIKSNELNDQDNSVASTKRRRNK